MRRGSSAATLIVILLAATQAFGMLADVPLPKLVLDSDLVVVGVVKKNAEPTEMTLELPGWPGAGKQWFVRSTFQVERFLHNPNKPAGGRANDIEILAITPAPRDPGAGPMLMHSEMFFANLQPGQKYLLILHKLPGRKEYYVPTYPKNYILVNDASQERVAETEKVCDVERWPWGKEVNGLQLALVPSASRIPLSRSRKTRGGPFFDSALVNVTFALRNTSKNPIALNVYRGDRYLSLTYASPGHAVKTHNFYGARVRLAPWSDEKHVLEIPPGEIVFIGPHGPGGYGTHVALEAPPGMLTLQAGYSSDRKASSKSGLNLWTGTLHSADAEVEVIRN